MQIRKNIPLRNAISRVSKIYHPNKQSKTPVKNRRVNTMLYFTKRESDQCKSAGNQSQRKRIHVGAKTIESVENCIEIPNPLPQSQNYKHSSDMISQNSNFPNRSICQSYKSINKSKIYEFNVNNSKIFDDSRLKEGRNYKHNTALTEEKIEKLNADSITSRAKTHYASKQTYSTTTESMEIDKGIRRIKPISERKLQNTDNEVLESRYLVVFGEPNIFNIVGIKHKDNKYTAIKFVLFNIETQLNLEIGSLLLDEPQEYNKISLQIAPLLQTNNYEEILQAITQIKGFQIDPQLLEKLKEENEATSELEPIKSQYSLEDEN